ncbi:hypothetical protein GZH47_33820, partial (plasmid) [Paenibacillus rhizovicinus]
SLEFSDIIEVKYKLNYSYMLDYNYDVSGDVAMLTLHSNYVAESMKNMEILYEGAKNTPFYRAEEIVFNPLLNHNHRGFLYMTERTEDAVDRILITVSPKTLPADGLSKATITAQIKDLNNNPIENKRIEIYRDGEIIYTGMTNQAGEVYKLDQPIAPASRISKYEAICEGKSSTGLLNYYEPAVADRYHIVLNPSKTAIRSGQNEQTIITVSLKNENWIGLGDKSITISYKDTKGVTRSEVILTNSSGDAKIALNGINEIQGQIAVHANFDIGGETASNFIYIKVIGG